MSDTREMQEMLQGLIGSTASVGLMSQGMAAYDNFAAVALRELLQVWIAPTIHAIAAGAHPRVEEIANLAGAAWSVADAMMDERKRRMGTGEAATAPAGDASDSPAAPGFDFGEMPPASPAREGG